MDLVEAKGFAQDRHPWELARAVFFDRVILKAISGKPVRFSTLAVAMLGLLVNSYAVLPLVAQ